jgi:hypothetical protein
MAVSVGQNETWTPEALQQLAAQLPGKPLRVNFQGESVGRVVSARVEGDHVEVEVETDDGATVRARLP